MCGCTHGGKDFKSLNLGRTVVTGDCKLLEVNAGH